jgi:hypothetical protein
MFTMREKIILIECLACAAAVTLALVAMRLWAEKMAAGV